VGDGSSSLSFATPNRIRASTPVPIFDIEPGSAFFSLCWVLRKLGVAGGIEIEGRLFIDGVGGGLNCRGKLGVAGVGAADMAPVLPPQFGQVADSSDNERPPLPPERAAMFRLPFRRG